MNVTSWAIILACGERRDTEEGVTRFTRIKEPLTTRPSIFQQRVTRFQGKGKVKAVPLCQSQGVFEVVDICSLVLCRYVAGGTPENRVDKVFLLEEHTPVVWAFPSVVEREDARMLFARKVSSQCVSAYGVIVVG